jgi:hypothetical protein
MSYQGRYRVIINILGFVLAFYEMHKLPGDVTAREYTTFAYIGMILVGPIGPYMRCAYRIAVKLSWDFSWDLSNAKLNGTGPLHLVNDTAIMAKSSDILSPFSCACNFKLDKLNTFVDRFLKCSKVNICEIYYLFRERGPDKVLSGL